MKEYIENYKKISNEILKLLSQSELNNKELERCFSKRQVIIDILDKENKIDDFKKIYTEKLYPVDIEIKAMLSQNINDIKKEIIQHKRNTNMSTTYSNMSKNKLNIFSKRV